MITWIAFSSSPSCPDVYKIFEIAFLLFDPIYTLCVLFFSSYKTDTIWFPDMQFSGLPLNIYFSTGVGTEREKNELLSA